MPLPRLIPSWPGVPATAFNIMIILLPPGKPACPPSRPCNIPTGREHVKEYTNAKLARPRVSGQMWRTLCTTATQGQAFCLQVFDHWSIVPGQSYTNSTNSFFLFFFFSGDPTDATIKLRPLEPASGQALARDLVLKTRRRKGLGDQISVSRYLDDEFVVSPSPTASMGFCD